VATVDDSAALAPAGDEEDFYPDSAAEFALLDVYDEAPASLGQARPDALATISAGDRGEPGRDGKPGLPRVSRDGKIVLHDDEKRAPGLRAALEATEYKSLTVAFPFSDLRLFWQERFSRYSATRLEVYGDADELREIVVGPNGSEHVLYLAGSAEYDRLRKSSKVSTSIYFALASWERLASGWTPRILFPDGLALYRLRTTSRHSRRNLLGALQSASKFTGGQIAGLPFELRLTYREVPDPTGAKRRIPVWSLLFKPPEAIALSTNTWPSLRDAAIAEGRVLQSQPALQAPQPETWQMAESEQDIPAEPSDEDLARMLAGDSPADADHWRRVWFTVTDHTVYSQDAARHAFFKRYTEGRTSSLAGFLKEATNGEAEAMIEAAVEDLNLASGVGAPTNIQTRPPLPATREERLAMYARIARMAEGSTAPSEVTEGRTERQPQPQPPRTSLPSTDSAPQADYVPSSPPEDRQANRARAALGASPAPPAAPSAPESASVASPVKPEEDRPPAVQYTAEGEEVQHEPTPFDDVELYPEAAAQDEAAQDEAFFPPEEEQGPVDAPSDADQREAVRQWLEQVGELIAEANRKGKSRFASRELQIKVGKLLMATVDGDEDEAKRLLRILSGGKAATAGRLTVAQCEVFQLLAGNERLWRECCRGALAYPPKP